MQGNRNQIPKNGASDRNGSSKGKQETEGNKEQSTSKGTESKASNTPTTFLQGCLGCFGLIVLIGIVIVVIVVLLGDETKSAESNHIVQTEETKYEITDVDSDISSRIIKEVGEQTNMGEQKIIDLQVNEHSGTDNDGDRIVVATLHANDNLSNKLMKGGIQMESIKVFQSLFEVSDMEEVALLWQFPTIDSYGNSELNTVLKITLTKATADKINWSYFNRDNFAQIADSYWEHPTLRE